MLMVRLHALELATSLMQVDVTMVTVASQLC